ncbi:protein PERCC1-like [Glandiceps talaboti]
MTECITQNPLYLKRFHHPHQQQMDQWSHDESEEETDIEDIEDYDESDGGEPVGDVEQNVTKQLLSFAEMVNTDIQKYFGRKKDSDDSCNIYEDRFSTGKSGRELYYADLLKIAQAGDPLSDELKPRSRAKDDDRKKKRTVVVNTDYVDLKGKSKSIGPLNELFDFAIGKHVAESRIVSTNHCKKIKRLKRELKRHDNVIPWQNRNLPKSFFKEPNSPVKKNGILHPSCNTPDFSDLMDIYNDDDFSGSGDLSSSDQEINVASVESVHDNHV